MTFIGGRNHISLSEDGRNGSSYPAASRSVFDPRGHATERDRFAQAEQIRERMESVAEERRTAEAHVKHVLHWRRARIGNRRIREEGPQVIFDALAVWGSRACGHGTRPPPVSGRRAKRPPPSPHARRARRLPIEVRARLVFDPGVGARQAKPSAISPWDGPFRLGAPAAKGTVEAPAYPARLHRAAAVERAPAKRRPATRRGHCGAVSRMRRA